MLRQLRLHNLGVIADATLDLHPGFTALTGETGAGKTMVVSGLGLLLGDRADAGRVRAGEARALVEGIAAVPDGHPALRRALDAGAELDDGDLLMSRTVAAEGRSRAHVGGVTVPVGVLSEVGHALVTVHGQADQWRLRRPEEHRAVLDAFDPVVGEALRAYVQVHDSWRAAAAELASLRRAAHERARTIDALTEGLEEIEALDPQPGEDEQLRAEDERLGHADALRDHAARAQSVLLGTDNDWDAGESAWSSVSSGIASVADELSSARALDPAAATLHERAVELGYLVAELGTDVASYVADLEVDPARLEWVQQRRAALGRLQRRYGDSVDDVLAWAKDAAGRLAGLEAADERIETLQGEVARLTDELARRAAALHRARKQAAQMLAGAIEGELHSLAMPKARVVVEVTPRLAGASRPGEPGDDRPDAGDPVGPSVGLPAGEDDGPDGGDGRRRLVVDLGDGPVAVTPSRDGVDEVQLLLAANTGAQPRSVTRAASGGELSRVMLAIEVATHARRDDGDVPTFVFDEVDAGVGGAAAVEIGRRLAALAEHAQVVVVTHLPQVAAFADRHLVVTKADDGNVAASGVVEVAGDDRVAEIARMMSGAATPEALGHAAQLLAAGALRGDPADPAPAGPKRPARVRRARGSDA